MALCECGCGQDAGYYDQPKQRHHGQPKRFVKGHNMRGKALKPRYRIENRGYKTACWTWLMAKNNMGYGTLGGGTSADCSPRGLAHRIFYEELFGPVPDGLVLDHLCRHPDCVNPEHLEPVTQRENCRRGAKPGRKPRVLA